MGRGDVFFVVVGICSGWQIVLCEGLFFGFVRKFSRSKSRDYLIQSDIIWVIAATLFSFLWVG